jgi:hypothetical protein
VPALLRNRNLPETVCYAFRLRQLRRITLGLVFAHSRFTAMTPRYVQRSLSKRSATSLTIHESRHQRLVPLYISVGAGIILIVAAVCLCPLELDANTIFTLAGAFLGLVVGQWVLVRKSL